MEELNSLQTILVNEALNDLGTWRLETFQKAMNFAEMDIFPLSQKLFLTLYNMFSDSKSTVKTQYKIAQLFSSLNQIQTLSFNNLFGQYRDSLMLICQNIPTDSLGMVTQSLIMSIYKSRITSERSVFSSLNNFSDPMNQSPKTYMHLRI